LLFKGRFKILMVANLFQLILVTLKKSAVIIVFVSLLIWRQEADFVLLMADLVYEHRW